MKKKETLAQIESKAEEIVKLVDEIRKEARAALAEAVVEAEAAVEKEPKEQSEREEG